MDTLWFNIVQWLHTVGLHIDGGTARAVRVRFARDEHAQDDVA